MCLEVFSQPLEKTLRAQITSRPNAQLDDRCARPCYKSRMPCQTMCIHTARAPCSTCLGIARPQRRPSRPQVLCPSTVPKRCPYSGGAQAVVPTRWCPSSAQAAGGGPQLAAAPTSSSRAACPRGWGSTLPSGRARRSRCCAHTHCRTRPRRGRRERPSGRLVGVRGRGRVRIKARGRVRVRARVRVIVRV